MEDAETMMQRRQPYVLCGFLIRLQRVSLAVKKEVGGDSQTAKIPDLDILVNAISSQLLRSSKAIIGSNESLDRSLTASA